MALRVHLCTTVLAALAPLSTVALVSAEPQLPPPPVASHPEHSESPTKIAIVQVPLPAAGDTWSLSDLPETVSKLLLDGWRIQEVRDAGRSADGKEVELVLVLGKAAGLTMNLPEGGTLENPQDGMPGFPGMPFRFFGLGAQGAPGESGQEPGQAAEQHARPGADAPAGPLDPGTLTVHWKDGHLTTITIGEAIGARAKAKVSTADASGKVLAEYDATAFKDAQGLREIDGRGAPLGNPAGDYSPDSFRIHPDGAVEIQDDQGNRDQGSTDHAVVPHADGAPQDHQL